MSDDHHHDALMETARSELERAHAAAVAMTAGEMRRGLELALGALREAAALPAAQTTKQGVVQLLEQALAELDDGHLADMEAHLERARAELQH